ncbi:MAG TPA: DEAD/DEAH box helicase family protein, partial [Bacteroidota bacterium]|nr:DEAD/DEAH box helicase family protein [Bacteroidota bacterium]
MVDAALAHDQGVIVAPAGSGKTIVGLELIARRHLPALILVHRKQIFDQWVERIQEFLGIPK